MTSPGRSIVSPEDQPATSFELFFALVGVLAVVVAEGRPSPGAGAG